MDSTRRKKVLCPLEGKNGKTFWMKIGTAWINNDGSTNVYLDAFPSNAKLQIRDLDEQDLKPRARGADDDAGAGREADGVPF
jgi:hypothetical protein